MTTTKSVLDVQQIHEFQRRFIAERQWEKFHTPKNLVMALSGEAGELSEIFQWMSETESSQLHPDHPKFRAVSDELADVLYYVLRIADLLKIDIHDAFWTKMKANALKYPVELARGNAKKYTEL